MRRTWWAIATLACCVATPRPVQGAGPPSTPSALQVPYLAQSWLLCGGAAIAMVERWWGRRGVFAEEFAQLVRPELGGILTTDLVDATRARGWDAESFVGNAARVQAALADSLPVIALIEVSRDRFHYVVILGWADGTIVMHDPAVGPYETRDESEFMTQWEAADRWALLVTPRPGVIPPPTAAAMSPLPAPPLPCAPWLDAAVGAAQQDDLPEALRQLALAERACPDEPLVLREAAGIAFRQGNYAQSVTRGRAYLQRAPTDTLAWQLVATAQYLTGDRLGALESWNTIGVPSHDLLRIDGRDRIPFRVLAGAMNLPLGPPLDRQALAMAERRLRDVPGVENSRLAYVPVSGGRVEVHATVLERPRFPSLPRLLLINGGRALAAETTELEVANLLGRGERFEAELRWRRSNPGVAVRLEFPVDIAPLVFGISQRVERFRFDDGTTSEQRRSSGSEARGWISPHLELLGGVQLEEWGGDDRYAAVTLGGGFHSPTDRIVATAALQAALARGNSTGFRRARLALAWRSTVVPDVPNASIHAGVDHVTTGAPRGLWPIAGGGISQPIPLRAHPFLLDDLLPTDRTARMIVHGGITADRPLGFVGPLSVGVGAFVDAASIGRASPGPIRRELYLDAGIGVQIGLPGASGMRFRLDLAHALHPESRWGVSAGLVQPWPPRVGGFR